MCASRGSPVKEVGTWGGNERAELRCRCESSELPPDPGRSGRHSKVQKEQTLGRASRKGSPSALLRGTCVGAVTMGSSMAGPYKTRARVAAGPSSLAPQQAPGENYHAKGTRAPALTAALATVAKTRQQPQRPSAEEWIKAAWSMQTLECSSAVESTE